MVGLISNIFFSWVKEDGVNASVSCSHTLPPLCILILQSTQVMSRGERPRVYSKPLVLYNLVFTEDEGSEYW